MATTMVIIDYPADPGIIIHRYPEETCLLRAKERNGVNKTV